MEEAHGAALQRCSLRFCQGEMTKIVMNDGTVSLLISQVEALARRDDLLANEGMVMTWYQNALID